MRLRQLDGDFLLDGSRVIGFILSSQSSGNLWMESFSQELAVGQCRPGCILQELFMARGEKGLDFDAVFYVIKNQQIIYHLWGIKRVLG